MPEFIEDKANRMEAKRRIGALHSDGDYPPEELEEIRQWLVEVFNDGFITELLYEKFLEECRPTPCEELNAFYENSTCLTYKK